MNYTFHPAAEAEYLEAIAFYESKRPGLGASYLEEFERVMVSICQAPHRNPMEERFDVRRMSMKKFPFTVIYREIPTGVQILAIAHHWRRPLYWMVRTGSSSNA